MTKEILTQARLKGLLHYDPDTGVFFWVAPTGSKVKPGAIAGCTRKDGYKTIRICGHSYLAHRLAWFYITGGWPKNQIDHMDGSPSNNAWENLRDVTLSVNMQNQRKARANNCSTKLLGATFEKRSGLFQAQIVINGKNKYLGLFDTAEQAHEAYAVAKRKFHEGCTI